MFDGQSHVDIFSIDLAVPNEVEAYRLRLALEAIRRHVGNFRFWQRRKKMGRPNTMEKTVLIGLLLQQLFGATFRYVEGLLHLLREYYRNNRIPDHSVLCTAMSSWRWTSLLERFFRHVLEDFRERKAAVATDTIGFSGRKRGWRETPYALRANEIWVKVHATIEVDEFLVLSYELTASNVHESQMFCDVRKRLPENVAPIRGLADAAYSGEARLAAARLHGATPLHSLKKNAKGLRSIV
jgi:hypothetical protein